MVVGAGSIHTGFCFDFLLGMILCDPGLGPNAPCGIFYDSTGIFYDSRVPCELKHSFLTWCSLPHGTSVIHFFSISAFSTDLCLPLAAEAGRALPALLRGGRNLPQGLWQGLLPLPLQRRPDHNQEEKVRLGGTPASRWEGAGWIQASLSQAA